MSVSIKYFLLSQYLMPLVRETIGKFLKMKEPELVNLHKCHKFRRKQFWSAGVMDILTVDQHNKWKCFGLFLHAGLDPFPGCILWTKIWWMNRDPWLVCSYYLEACQKEGGMSWWIYVFRQCPLTSLGIPMVTQSDLGTENNVMANCHTSIWHQLDPSLQGTIQH